MSLMGDTLSKNRHNMLLFISFEHVGPSEMADNSLSFYCGWTLGPTEVPHENRRGRNDAFLLKCVRWVEKNNLVNSLLAKAFKMACFLWNF